MTAEEAYAKFKLHMEKLTREGFMFPIALDATLAVCFVSQLQLALRKPGNTGCSATMTRGLVDAVIDQLDDASPGLGAILKLGWDPAYDGKPGERGF